MKILCLCRRGNSRSVTCAYVLKHWHKQDALAAGTRNNQGKTLVMLCKWAETIILTDVTLLDDIPIHFRSKLRIWDVGTDRFFAPPERLRAMADYLESAKRAKSA